MQIATKREREREREERHGGSGMSQQNARMNINKNATVIIQDKTKNNIIDKDQPKKRRNVPLPPNPSTFLGRDTSVVLGHREKERFV